MLVLTIFLVILTNIIVMLTITLVIAALTLIERKFLSLSQRRVGPFYVGYHGRLQYIADALKLFLKGSTVHDENNKF
jgi:NADH-quinone oxidoreductase subunit H